MRQLKGLMKAERPMWRCGECKCVTLQCWRENDEFCNCGTSSEGLWVEYKFKDWDGRILKQWSIEEWTTPIPPADPTREATAEYTYTFAGWDPEVEPIGEDTVYTATYSSELNYYDITITFDGTMWSTDIEFLGGNAYGEPISANGNVLTVWEWYEATEITATPFSGYEFSSWGNFPATVTGDLTITANFIPTLNNVIDAMSENSACVLTDGNENFVEVTIDTDQEDPVVTASPFWIFADEMYMSEGEYLWANMFSVIDPEVAETIINTYFNFPTNVFEAMKAYYENPTAANYEAAEQALSDWDADPSTDFSTIESDLTSLDAEQLQEQITEIAESGELLDLVINGRTYTLEAVSENSADVFVNINGIEYGTSVSIEADVELWTYTLVVWEKVIIPVEDAPQSTPEGE